jgi:hypothetical protein
VLAIPARATVGRSLEERGEVVGDRSEHADRVKHNETTSARGRAVRPTGDDMEPPVIRSVECVAPADR